VLHDVERRALLVQPAREGPPPAVVELLHVELHEGAGQILIFPRRGALAGAQADDDVADARGLAGLERHVAGLAVALVEQAEHRDALSHRRRAVGRVRALGHLDHRDVGGAFLLVERRRLMLRRLLSGLTAAPPAIADPGAQPDQDRDRRSDGELPSRHPSGAQAS